MTSMEIINDQHKVIKSRIALKQDYSIQLQTITNVRNRMEARGQSTVRADRILTQIEGLEFRTI